MKAFLYILLLFPFFASAQPASKSAEIFCTNDYNGQQAIRVKWIYTTVYHPNGMDVFRQEKGSTEWMKLNAAPVLPTKILPANNTLDAEAKALHKALIESKFSDFSTSPIRAFVLIKALYADELANYIGITWLDNKVEQGKEYVYKISVSGTTTEIGMSKAIVSGPYVKPLPPEGAKLTRYKKHIDISWKPDIYRYYAVDVYRKISEESDYKKINKVPRAIQKEQAEKYSEKSIFYQDTDIVYSANYTYRFVALDYFGQASEQSQAYSVPSADFIPPALPYDIVPTGSSLNGAIRLDWKLVDEKDLAGVNIYYSSNPEKPYQKINQEVIPKSQLTFSHTNLPAGTNYYQLASIDNAGNENKSAPVFVELKDTRPPAKPNGLTSEPGEGFITLKWKANTEGDLMGYHVQRSLKSKSTNTASYVNVTKNPIKEISYTEQLPRNVRNEFVYRIVAIDTNFNRSQPSENTLARMPDVNPPLQPVIKNIKCDSTKAIITWLANVDPDVQGYNLYRSIAGDSLTLAKVNFSLIPATISIYNDRQIKAGQAYTYYLEALDSSGNASTRSPGFYVKPADIAISGQIQVQSKKYNSKKGTLSLDWKGEASEAFEGFVVYHQPAKEVPFKPISGMIKEQESTLTIGDKVAGLFYIKGYTVKGKMIQSEKFSITNE